MEVKKIINDIRDSIKNSYLEIVEKGIRFSRKKYEVDGIRWSKENRSDWLSNWTKIDFFVSIHNAEDWREADFYSLTQSLANEQIYQALQVIDYTVAKFADRIDSLRVNDFSLIVSIDGTTYYTSLDEKEED